MRVKVTHTMEYEEVPSFMNDLLEQCHKKLSRHTFLKFNLFDMQDTVRQILEYRKDLALVDQQLEDCLGVVQGYMNVSNPSDSESAEGNNERTD